MRDTANGSLLPNLLAHLSSARTRHEQAQSASTAFVRPRNALFHEHGAELLYMHSVMPRFQLLPHSRAVAQLRAWSWSIEHGHTWREKLNGSFASGTCAVVGSSTSLLRSLHGRFIDSHDAVYRVNRAPTAGYGRFVGRRTSVRVWGDQTLPEDAAPRWLAPSEALVIYCGPVSYVGHCWRKISRFPWPRLSPIAFEEAALSIHGEGFSPWRGLANKFPTSGAMAVWLALARCRQVSAFGFGACADESRATAADRAAVYYDPEDHRHKKGFGVFHDAAAEGRWLHRLHGEGVLRLVC